MSEPKRKFQLTTISLSPKERQLIDRLKAKTKIFQTTELVRWALRKAAAQEGIRKEGK